MKDCVTIARIISAGRTKHALVEIEDIQADLHSSGVWWDIEDVAANSSHPAYKAARAIIDVSKARYKNLDTSKPIVAQMLGGLVATGVMSQEQMDRIINMAIQPDVITAQEVADAIFYTNGTLK